jgi:hypothetical protein
MQLYSLVQQKDNILHFSNAFLNLAISMYLITEPFPKKVNKDKFMNKSILSKAIPDGWSAWENIEITGPMTINEFKTFMLNNYAVNLLGIKDDEMEADFVDVNNPDM